MKLPILGNLDLKSVAVGAVIFWILDTYVLKEALTGRAYVSQTQNTLGFAGRGSGGEMLYNLS